MSLAGWLIARALPFGPKSVVASVARRYIAGETLDDGLRAAAALNARGFRTTLDLLGEDTTRPEQATRALTDYREALRAIDARGIDGNVSVKPTQFGLRIDADLCLRLFRELAGDARKLGHFVRVEMEDSGCTDRTLAVYRALRQDFQNVGIVLQSCLRRTPSDLAGLLDLYPNVRMVKGVYVEPETLAWQGRDAIRARYVELSRTVLANGSFVAFATHDDDLVDAALDMVREFGVPSSGYEFQMLLGVRPELGERLLGEGHAVRIYVPFGSDWHPYSTRRLRENPRIAGYVLRALLPRRKRPA
jgi:proline dehydrogenase